MPSGREDAAHFGGTPFRYHMADLTFSAGVEAGSPAEAPVGDGFEPSCALCGRLQWGTVRALDVHLAEPLLPFVFGRQHTQSVRLDAQKPDRLLPGGRAVIAQTPIRGPDARLDDVIGEGEGGR